MTLLDSPLRAVKLQFCDPKRRYWLAVSSIYETSIKIQTHRKHNYTIELLHIPVVAEIGQMCNSAIYISSQNYPLWPSPPSVRDGQGSKLPWIYSSNKTLCGPVFFENETVFHPHWWTNTQSPLCWRDKMPVSKMAADVNSEIEKKKKSEGFLTF